MFYDLIHISCLTSSKEASLKAVKLSQSKMCYPNLWGWPVTELFRNGWPNCLNKCNLKKSCTSTHCTTSAWIPEISYYTGFIHLVKTLFKKSLGVFSFLFFFPITNNSLFFCYLSPLPLNSLNHFKIINDNWKIKPL